MFLLHGDRVMTAALGKRVNFMSIGAYAHPIMWCTLSPRIGIAGLRLSHVTSRLV
jgi:hypothetical protein